MTAAKRIAALPADLAQLRIDHEEGFETVRKRLDELEAGKDTAANRQEGTDRELDRLADLHGQAFDRLDEHSRQIAAPALAKARKPRATPSKPDAPVKRAPRKPAAK